jgi:hypothetical protein
VVVRVVLAAALRPAAGEATTRVTEVEVRAMLEKATVFEPNVVEGRFMIHVRHLQSPWIVIVEPDADAKLLVVVTVYQVSQ